jgi:hypothetical protein
MHVFEVLDCIAVTLSANAFNVESRRAIERLGAKLDGVLRNLYKVKSFSKKGVVGTLAGVVLVDDSFSTEIMQGIAFCLGASETAFSDQLLLNTAANK